MWWIAFPFGAILTTECSRTLTISGKSGSPGCLQLLCNYAMTVSVMALTDKDAAPDPDAGTTARGVEKAIAGSRMRLGELGSFIREQRRAARLSLRKLSDQAGISNPYLSQIERGLRKPSAEILQAIAKALRISAETLYVRAGILDERPDRDLVSEILQDSHLTDAQKQSLIATYRNYVELGRDPQERAASVKDVTD